MGELFVFHVSAWELVARGTAMYWFLFLIFRFVLRRDVGAVAIADVLLLVLIADASQNAMSGGYQTVAEGCLLVGTIVGWNYLLDWASYRFEPVRKLAEPPPLPLIWRGRILHRNLRKEFLPVADLMGKLRQEGVDDVAHVKAAYMESDGQISVVRFRD